MTEYEREDDAEQVLRKYRPPGPPAALRQRILDDVQDVFPAGKRHHPGLPVRRWAAVAAVATLAVLLRAGFGVYLVLFLFGTIERGY